LQNCTARLEAWNTIYIYIYFILQKGSSVCFQFKDHLHIHEAFGRRAMAKTASPTRWHQMYFSYNVKKKKERGMSYAIKLSPNFSTTLFVSVLNNDVSE